MKLYSALCRNGLKFPGDPVDRRNVRDIQKPEPGTTPLPTVESQIALLSGLTTAAPSKTSAASLPRLRSVRATSADSLGELFVEAIHEFRPALRSMLDIADTLRLASVSAEFRDLPDRLYNTARSVLDRVNSFADIVRLQNGEAAPLKVAFDLELAISDLFDLLAPAAEARSIELVFSLSPDLPRRAMGDPDRIRQIVRDLVESTIRHTDSGFVSLRLSPAPSGSVAEGVLLRASLRASQTGDSSRRARADVQVGLAHRLVAHLGGALTQTENGEAVFTVPLASDPEIWEDPPLPANIAQMTALTVGLSPLVRDAFSEQMSAAGVTIAAAGGCDQAVSLLAEASRWPDMIFVDMARESGWDEFGRWTGRKWKESNRGAAAPLCIAVAPAGAVPGRAQLESAGYAAVLGRVFTRRKVRGLLRQFFGSRTQNPPVEGQVPGARRRSGISDRDQAFAGLVSPRILVVLSEADESDRISRILANLGCRADIILYDSEQSVPVGPVKQRSGSVYDLALIELKRKDSPEIVARIRDQWPAGRVPLIGLAGEADPEIRARAMAAGVNHLLDKPLHEGQMGRLLAQWIDRAGVHPAFDYAAVLGRCGGDEDLMADLAAELRSHMDRLSTAIRSAIGRQDAREASLLLRQLIEQAEFFAAAKLAGSARKIERLVADCDWPTARGGMGVVRVHMVRLFEQLAARRVA